MFKGPLVAFVALLAFAALPLEANTLTVRRGVVHFTATDPNIVCVLAVANCHLDTLATDPESPFQSLVGETHGFPEPDGAGCRWETSLYAFDGPWNGTLPPQTGRPFPLGVELPLWTTGQCVAANLRVVIAVNDGGPTGGEYGVHVVDACDLVGVQPSTWSATKGLYR